MRIGIDARVLDKKMTGTGRYLINLLNEIPHVDKKNEYFLFTNTSIPFDGKFYKIVRYKESKIPNKLYSPIWINKRIPELVEKYDIDLLFSANVFAPFRKMGNTKCVSVVHDSIYKIYKEYYPLSWRIYKSLMLPGSVKNSDIVITVSNHSKHDLIKYDNVPEEKIRVVYNTASDQFNSEPGSDDEYKELVNELSIPQKYLLYVGVVERRKNIIGLLKIMDLLRDGGSDLKLVIIGKPGFDSKNILPEIEKRKDFIKHYKYIDDKYLTKIFNYSFAFVFPSYYEGFGIPPLEAMQCGIPVISSNRSALPEVVGEGGILHDPDDHEGITKSIRKLENDYKFYNLMKSKSLEQSKKFNIYEITQGLVEIFNELG